MAAPKIASLATDTEKQKTKQKTNMINIRSRHFAKQGRKKAHTHKKKKEKKRANKEKTSLEVLSATSTHKGAPKTSYKHDNKDLSRLR